MGMELGNGKRHAPPTLGWNSMQGANVQKGAAAGSRLAKRVIE
jgi:hypothetical protein